MKPDDWEVGYDDGIFLPQIDWWADAHKPREHCLISHAHFDHLSRHREIVCSELTSKLMKARMPGRRIEHRLAFGQTEALTHDCSVTLYPAGHIPGSAMILLEHAAYGRFLYTGDFKLRAGLAVERCDPPRADVLVMETTYGRSHYRMPPLAQVCAEIVDFCRDTLADGDTPVLYGYSLGRGQELLHICTSAGLKVYLHAATAAMTRTLAEAGVNMPPFSELVVGQPVSDAVVICPAQGSVSPVLKSLTNPRTAAVTGWALDPGIKYRYRCDAAFALSDHADYDELIEFVQRVSPRRVLTTHGFAEDFARTLRGLGYDASELGKPNQLELGIG